MTSPSDPFALAHWRRTVAALYAHVRERTEDRRAQCESFRRAKDDLFRSHPQSPIAEHLRADWPGVQWFPYDPAARVDAAIEPAASRETFDIALASDGVLHCTRVGLAHFTMAGRKASSSKTVAVTKNRRAGINAGIQSAGIQAIPSQPQNPASAIATMPNET